MNSLGGMAKWQEALCVYIKATVKGPCPLSERKRDSLIRRSALPHSTEYFLPVCAYFNSLTEREKERKRPVYLLGFFFLNGIRQTGVPHSLKFYWLLVEWNLEKKNFSDWKYLIGIKKTFLFLWSCFNWRISKRSGFFFLHVLWN